MITIIQIQKETRKILQKTQKNTPQKRFPEAKSLFFDDAVGAAKNCFNKYQNIKILYYFFTKLKYCPQVSEG